MRHVGRERSPTETALPSEGGVRRWWPITKDLSHTRLSSGSLYLQRDMLRLCSLVGRRRFGVIVNVCEQALAAGHASCAPMPYPPPPNTLI